MSKVRQAREELKHLTEQGIKFLREEQDEADALAVARELEDGDRAEPEGKDSTTSSPRSQSLNRPYLHPNARER